jgi:hypothetical protein
MKRSQRIPSMMLEALEDRVIPSHGALRAATAAAEVRMAAPERLPTHHHVHASRHHMAPTALSHARLVGAPGTAATPPVGTVVPVSSAPAPVGSLPAGPGTISAPSSPSLALNGGMSGGLISAQGFDQGTNLPWSGAGQLGPLGQVRFQGSVTLNGLQGPTQMVRALLTLSNAEGSVTVNVVNDPDLPEDPLRYEIVGGTGAYQGATGGGAAALELGGPLVRDISAPTPTYGFSLGITFGEGPGAIVPL